MRDSIGVLLTGYRRPELLKPQYDAVRAQTLPPDRIALWVNHHPGTTFDDLLLSGIPHVVSNNTNWGVHSRFSFAYELDTDFVCVFDDDTIPGTRWLSNCYASMKKQEGLYGTNGIRFPRRSRYPTKHFGVHGPCDEATRVDIVGHAWFLRRDWLRWFVFEPRQGGLQYGEDYHLSFSLQKHVGVDTFVPPHPTDRKELWGSVRVEEGRDSRATYAQPGIKNKIHRVHDLYLREGWRVVADGSAT